MTNHVVSARRRASPKGAKILNLLRSMQLATTTTMASTSCLEKKIRNKLAKAKTNEQAESERWKIRFYKHDYPPSPTKETYREIVAFKTWRAFLTPAALKENAWTQCFAADATRIAERAEAQADQASTTRFLN